MGSDAGQYANLTLAEALAQFRTDEGLDEPYRGISDEARPHFDRHDTLHVLFGLSTDMDHEVRADGWALFGSDIGWRDVKEFYSLPEYKELMRELGTWNVTKAFLKNLPALFGIARKGRRMRKRWPWSGHEKYRDKPVGVIREEFGIRREWLSS